jgi:hypothetical protein
MRTDPGPAPPVRRVLLAAVIALLGTSPAVNAIATADCAVTTDQRGVTRPQSTGRDVGAFERDRFSFGSFFQPVDNLPTFNRAKAGSAVPVKFSPGGNQALAIFDSGYPRSNLISCTTGTLPDDIEQTVTAGGSSLSYDPTTKTYTYVWKTDEAWAGTCRQLTTRLTDGTDHQANITFTK